MSEDAPARISSVAVFRRPDFVLMWVAQLVSTAGSSLTDLAAGIYVYQQTQSAFLVGVTLMATAVPSLIVGLIAGVYVDRHDRRKIMIASNLAQAVVVALIPFVLGINVSLLFVAILINAGVKQFFDPAYEALIPEIASDEELTAANAFLSIASFGSTAIGFAGGRPAHGDRRALGVLDRRDHVHRLRRVHLGDADARGQLDGAERRTPRSGRSWRTCGSASGPSSTRRCCGRCSCWARRCSSRSACGTCSCCRWRSRSWGRRSSSTASRRA